jgi:hypothetical protein
MCKVKNVVPFRPVRTLTTVQEIYCQGDLQFYTGNFDKILKFLLENITYEILQSAWMTL